MKNAIFFLIVFLTFITCKKEDDPFFDTLPKTYYHEGIERTSDVRLYTGGIEILDTAIINAYASKKQFYADTFISSIFKDEVFSFVSNNAIVYSGNYNYLYDTLFYHKDGEMLYIKSEKIYSNFAAYKCKSFTCRLNEWKIDSIGEGPSTIGFYTISVSNKRFKIINEKLHVPVMSFKFNGMTAVNEGEFNSSIITETGMDTLLIATYNIIYGVE